MDWDAQLRLVEQSIRSPTNKQNPVVHSSAANIMSHQIVFPQFTCLIPRHVNFICSSKWYDLFPTNPFLCHFSLGHEGSGPDSRLKLCPLDCWITYYHHWNADWRKLCMHQTQHQDTFHHPRVSYLSICQSAITLIPLKRSQNQLSGLGLKFAPLLKCGNVEYCSMEIIVPSVDLCIPTRLMVCTLPQVWWGFECDWLCQFVYKAKPAPDWDRGRTLEMKRISAVFKLNRKLLKEKYSDPRYQPFRLRTLERPTNLETIREEVVSHPIDFRDHGNLLWNLWFLTNNMVH